MLLHCGNEKLFNPTMQHYPIINVRLGDQQYGICGAIFPKSSTHRGCMNFKWSGPFITLIPFREWMWHHSSSSCELAFCNSVYCICTSAVVGMFFPYRHVKIIGSRCRHACRHNSSFKLEWNTRRKTLKTKVSRVIHAFIIKLTLIPIHFAVIPTLVI